MTCWFLDCKSCMDRMEFLMGNLSNDFIYSMPDSAAEPIYAYPQKFVVRFSVHLLSLLISWIHLVINHWTPKII